MNLSLMRKYIFVLVLIMTVVHVPGLVFPSDMAVTGKEIIREIQTAYQRIDTLKGNFEQTIPLKGLGVTREAKGLFYVKKPEKTRWDYNSPVQQTYITNKNIYYFRRKGEKGFRRGRMEPRLMEVYNSLLGGGAPFDTLFSTGRVRGENTKVVELELFPAVKDFRSIKRVVLRWNRRAKTVEGMVVFLVTGEINALSFRDMVINENLPDDLFSVEITKQ